MGPLFFMCWKNLGPALESGTRNTLLDLRLWSNRREWKNQSKSSSILWFIPERIPDRTSVFGLTERQSCRCCGPRHSLLSGIKISTVWSMIQDRWITTWLHFQKPPIAVEIWTSDYISFKLITVTVKVYLSVSDLVFVQVSTATHPHFVVDAKMTGKDVLILYGSQTGNSEDIAKDLHERCSKDNISSVCKNLNSVKKVDLKEIAKFVVVVCSTTGNGDTPENAEAWWRSVKLRAAVSLNLFDCEIMNSFLSCEILLSPSFYWTRSRKTHLLTFPSLSWGLGTPTTINSVTWVKWLISVWRS